MATMIMFANLIRDAGSLRNTSCFAVFQGNIDPPHVSSGYPGMGKCTLLLLLFSMSPWCSTIRVPSRLTVALMTLCAFIVRPLMVVGVVAAS